MTNSAVDIAIFKIAVELYNNNRDLKREILCTGESEFFKRKRVLLKMNYRRMWFNIVDKYLLILKKGVLPKELQGKLLGAMRIVGSRILMWTEFLEGTVGFSREYSIDFLNSSHFTSHGIIDSKKAAEELIKLEHLNAMQRYRLACINCLADYIPDLYKQVTSAAETLNHQSSFRYKESAIEKFWTHCMTGEIDSVRGEKSLGEYRLEKAIESGSKAAVEYCLENTDFTSRDVLVEAALKTVRNKLLKQSFLFKPEDILNDWIIYDYPRDTDQSESWTESEDCADILCLLISKMTKDQCLEFLMKDIEDNKTQIYKNAMPSRALQYLLDWPYQNYFMKTIKLMWEFLPERTYFDLILTIARKIVLEKESLRSGEEKIYNYRMLLKEFWIQSPGRYRRYTLDNETVIDRRGKLVNKSAQLLLFLFWSKNFTCEDKEIISLILRSATNEEKENLITSLDGKDVCWYLIETKRLKLIEEFVSECFVTKERQVEFRKQLGYVLDTQRIFFNFAMDNEYKIFAKLLEFVCFSEDEINALKKQIFSKYGINFCEQLISFERKIDVLDKFVRFWISSEEELKEFKRKLAISYLSTHACNFLKTVCNLDKLECVNEFLNWSCSSEQEIRELKKSFVSEFGSVICKELIIRPHFTQKYYSDDEYGMFGDDGWNQIKKFFTWSSLSNQEILDLKNRFRELKGRENIRMGFLLDIHRELLADLRWTDINKFYDWLQLSVKEIREIKRKTVISQLGMQWIKDLTPMDPFLETPSCVMQKWELILDWCLIDKKEFLGVKSKIENTYSFHSYPVGRI